MAFTNSFIKRNQEREKMLQTRKFKADMKQKLKLDLSKVSKGDPTKNTIIPTKKQKTNTKKED
eukprot:UN27319